MNQEKREKKRGRPSLLTPELRSRLLELFGERFFLWIVVVRVGIDRHSIYEWGREQEPFRTDITHARAEWIKQLSEIRAFIYLSVKNDSKTRTKEGSKEGREIEKETGPEQRF